MNHLAVGVEGAMDANFLAFELLHLVLMVDVVCGAAVGILEHILVTRFHDDTGEDLDSGLLGLGLGIGRLLSRLVWRLPWLPRLLFGPLPGPLSWRLLLRRRLRWLRIELSAQERDPRYQHKHGKKPQRVYPLFSVHEASELGDPMALSKQFAKSHLRHSFFQIRLRGRSICTD
jgi:hypothetical protein